MQYPILRVMRVSKKFQAFLMC